MSCYSFQGCTLPKFNSWPLKSYRNPIGKDRFPTIIFQGQAVKFQGWELFLIGKTLGGLKPDILVGN